MAVIRISADNRTLTLHQRSSYLDDNYAAGTSTVLVANANFVAAANHVLLGEFGQENSEVMRINLVDAAANSVTFTAPTKFAHSESTKVTLLAYNQVRFYWTATDTFSAGTVLTTMDVQADDYFTHYTDTAHTTGFGWFCYYDTTSGILTGPSNAIPYANFGRDTVKRVVDGFRSLLNSTDTRLISTDDEMDWLNEGYSWARNELNMTSTEYGVSDATTISVVSGTKEYALPADFSDLVSIYNGTDRVYIDYLPINQVPDYDAVEGLVPMYYLRGLYIGFSPTPSDSATYTIRYKRKATELNSYYDTLDLPDNSSSILKDFMLFRAGLKLHWPNAQSYLELFTLGINRMKTMAIKRHAGYDSWGIDRCANV